MTRLFATLRMTYWGRCNFFNSLLKLEVKRMKFSEKLNSYFNALHFLQREKISLWFNLRAQHFQELGQPLRMGWPGGCGDEVTIHMSLIHW